jgi:RNA polymerase primary sigma factor
LTAVAPPNVLLEGDGEGAADALEQFFSEIGRYPLLSPAEEVRLAKRIERGDREARDRLITANLRLVVYVAKRFRGSGVQLVDLVQEGSLGLIRAVDRFDWRRGYRFSTYATWWIRQAVQRGVLRSGGGIRLPSNVAATVRDVRAWELQLLVRLQRQPTEREIADAAGIPLDHLRRLQRLGANALASLDEEVGDGGPLHELVPAPDELDEEVGRRVSSFVVRQAVGGLPPLERDVIRLRYGIEDGSMRSMSAVGQELGLSRDRVRTLERLALTRLAWSPQLVGVTG